MADFDQEAFFKLIFDDKDIKNKQIQLEKRTRSNKEAQKELNKEIKRVRVGSPQYDKLISKSVELKNEQKANTEEQSKFNYELKNTRQAGQTMKELTKDVGNFKIKATDSYNEAIAKNNLLRQTLKKSKGAFGENTKEVDKLKAALASNNKTLIDFDKNVNSGSRNVGRYKEDIGQLSGQFITLPAPIRAGIAALKIFKITLLSTGIGAIVVALGALVGGFLSTQRGVDAFNKVMRPLSAIFDRVIGLVQDLSFFLVDKLKGAFNDPVGAIKDLGQAILNNVINRFKAISVLGGGLVKLFTGDWRAGVKELQDGFIQLGTGVTNATDKIKKGVESVSTSISEAEIIGKKIDAITKKIEHSENKLTLSRGRLNRAYEESVLITKDQAKTDKERIDAANKAEASLRKLTDAEQELAKQRIELITLEQELNDTSREGVGERNALLAKVEQNEADFNKKLGRILAQRSGLLKKQITKDEAARQGEIEAIQSLQPKLLETELSDINALALTKEQARLDEAEANEVFRQNELAREQEFSDGKKALTQTLFNSTTSLLSSLLSAETKSNEDRAKARKAFLKGFLKDTITAVQSFLITQVVKATAGSLAQADSIASFGATGVARAAILTGLISAAGAGLKGLVDKFEYGGEVGGKRHSEGGTIYAGADGNKFEVEKGESIFVLKRNDKNKINAISQENVNRGGVPFSSNVNKSFFANGGVVTALREANKVSLSSDQLRVALSIEQFQTAENEFNTVQDAGDF